MLVVNYVWSENWEKRVYHYNITIKTKFHFLSEYVKANLTILSNFVLLIFFPADVKWVSVLKSEIRNELIKKCNLTLT